MTDLACRVKALSVQHMFSFLHNLFLQPKQYGYWLSPLLHIVYVRLYYR